MAEGKRKALVLLGCLLLGCGIKLVPVDSPGSGPAAGEGWAAVEGEGISFSARQGTLHRCPSSWDVVPFEVMIENRTEADLSVAPGDLTLIDDESRQYQAIDPRAFAAAAPGGSRQWCGPGMSFGFAYGWSGTGDPAWGFGFPLWYSETGSPHRCLDELLLRTLNSQPIKPGAFIQGLVLFRGRISPGSQLTIELKKGIIPENNTRLALRFQAG